jgi:hypothetical protein
MSQWHADQVVSISSALFDVFKEGTGDDGRDAAYLNPAACTFMFLIFDDRPDRRFVERICGRAARRQAFLRCVESLGDGGARSRKTMPALRDRDAARRSTVPPTASGSACASSSAPSCRTSPSAR